MNKDYDRGETSVGHDFTCIIHRVGIIIFSCHPEAQLKDLLQKRLG